MSIANELSSEIASALLLSKERSPEELSDLKNLLLEVHSTLQSMTETARAEREEKHATKAATNRF